MFYNTGYFMYEFVKFWKFLGFYFFYFVDHCDFFKIRTFKGSLVCLFGPILFSLKIVFLDLWESIKTETVSMSKFAKKSKIDPPTYTLVPNACLPDVPARWADPTAVPRVQPVNCGLLHMFRPFRSFGEMVPRDFSTSSCTSQGPWFSGLNVFQDG